MAEVVLKDFDGSGLRRTLRIAPSDWTGSSQASDFGQIVIIMVDRALYNISVVPEDILSDMCCSV